MSLSNQFPLIDSIEPADFLGGKWWIENFSEEGAPVYWRQGLVFGNEIRMHLENTRMGPIVFCNVVMTLNKFKSVQLARLNFF